MRTPSILNIVVDDLTTSVVRIISDPFAVLALFISGFFIYTHNHTDNSLINTLILKLQGVENLKFLGDWLQANIDKFIGLAAFLPAVLAAPYRRRMLFGLVAFVWVFTVPEGTAMEFVFQSFAMLVFFSARHPATRFILVVAVAVVYGLGYVKFPGSKKPVVASPAANIRAGGLPRTVTNS
jgi:hypothetical protein